MPSQPSRPDAALASTLPHLFIDRSLGAIQLPAILRENGVSLTTLREHYGVPADQRVEDTAWISLTAERGWIGFHKDAAIRRNEVERLTVLATGARLFCIPRADRSAQENAARFVNNLADIVGAAKQDGPFIYSLHPRTIERLL